VISLKELSDASAITAMILAAEKIEDDSPVNAGRDDSITMNQASGLVFERYLDLLFFLDAVLVCIFRDISQKGSRQT